MYELFTNCFFTLQYSTKINFSFLKICIFSKSDWWMAIHQFWPEWLTDWWNERLTLAIRVSLAIYITSILYLRLHNLHLSCDCCKFLHFVSHNFFFILFLLLLLLFWLRKFLGKKTHLSVVYCKCICICIRLDMSLLCWETALYSVDHLINWVQISRSKTYLWFAICMRPTMGADASVCPFVRPTSCRIPSE